MEIRQDDSEAVMQPFDTLGVSVFLLKIKVSLASSW